MMHVIRRSSLLVGLVLFACESRPAAVVSLSIGVTEDTSQLQVGQSFDFTVRAVTEDQTSTDVTTRASCVLTAQDPPGTLSGATFTAEHPGSTGLRCSYSGVSAELGITVVGNTTVKSIQQGGFAPEAAVQVTAVVTAIEPDDPYTNLWVQDAGGGAYSGIFCLDVRTEQTALGLAVGDVVTVSGSYTERKGRSIIRFSAVSKTGTAAVTEDPLNIDQVTAVEWDGCLVRLADVVVTNADLDDYSFEVAAESAPSGAKLAIDELLYNPTRAQGDVFTSITGVVYPWLDKSDVAHLALAPRGETDLVKKSSGVVTTTAKALQQGQQPVGTAVQASLVVTAKQQDGDYTNLWAQDQGGGAQSGIQLFDGRATPSALDVAVGDVVSVKGVYEETKGRSRVRYTELTKTGSAAVVVDPVALTDLDVASWDGCLVRVVDLVVTNPAVDSYTWEVATQADPSGARLLVDTLLYAPTVAQNDTFASITGVIFPWQSSGTQLFSLVPRDAADVVGQTSQFVSTTAKAIQNGEVAAQTAVELSVVVTAVQADGANTNFWAQDAGGGAKSGLYFYDARATATPLDLVPGDVVTVRGVYSERNNRTTVSFAEVQETGTAAPTVDTLNIADLNAALWEGCLVKVEAVTVANPAVDADTWQVRPTADPTGATLLVDHLLFHATVAMGDTFNSISGVVFAWGTATPQTFSLAPRDAADLQGQASQYTTTTAKALQQGQLAVGTAVQASLVVTAKQQDGDYTNLWAQDQGGGAQSGMQLFDGRATPSALDVAVGDVVSVKGVYEESNGRSRVRYTELIKTGAAAVVVDTVALAALDVASWDGCLVRVALVVVTNPAVDSYTWEVATQAEPSGARLLIDTLLYAPTVAQNDTFDSITGVVFPWQSGDTQLFSLVPRDAADLVGQASQFLSTTAKAIQNGEVAAQSAVELSVVVTAVQADGDYTHFWAQDAGGGAKSGLYFFDERVAPTPLDVVPGDVVTVRGVYSERNNRTTVSFTEVQETGTAAPTVDTLNIADLNAALWEGCLVKVEAVTVSNPAVDANTWQVRPTADPTGATLLVDHLLFQATVAMGDTFNSISGVVFAWGTATPQTFSLAPRDAADLVGQAGGKLTTTAAALQAGEVAQGSRVRVSGLVLSATKGTSPRDAFAEAEGVGLFLFDARTTVTAPYERGDVVTVEGVYDEYNGRTTVRFASIEVTGHTALAPKLLDRFALDLSQHESTLVRVQNLKAVADWSGYTIAMGDAQGTATDTLVTIEEYASTLDLISTDRFASVVGVVFCTTSGCNLSPRDNDDLGPTTITELRSGAIALDVRARIAEAVVFAARPFGAALDFYAQAEGGGEKSGLYFVDYDNVAPPVFTPGDVFQFVGKYKTKNGYPRFYYSSASDTGRDAVLVPSVVPLAALQAKATAEPYLQGLCTVTDVVVVESPVTVGVSTVGFRVRAAAGTDTLVVNTSLFAPTVALDQHLGSVTGFINEPVNNATHPVELFVRSAADVVE